MWNHAGYFSQTEKKRRVHPAAMCLDGHVSMWKQTVNGQNENISIPRLQSVTGYAILFPCSQDRDCSGYVV